MPRTPEQYEEIRNEKRQMIMDVALNLFANKGFHSTSISQIAEKANISKGLIYNYFESKEHLLKSITTAFSNEIMDRMNPDNDNEITREEAIQFFEWYFNMLKENKEQMKLYFQLSVQPQVLKILLDDKASELSNSQQNLIFSFLSRNSSYDPMVCLIHLSSVLKGFALQYVYAPEMFTDEIIDKYKQYLIDRYIFNK